MMEKRPFIGWMRIKRFGRIGFIKVREIGGSVKVKDNR